MAVSRECFLKLYRNLLRESRKFPAYNYRMYALRRVKDAFKQNKDVKDSEKLSALYTDGLHNLELIKRQVLIGQLYRSSPLIIETLANSELKNQP